MFRWSAHLARCPPSSWPPYPKANRRAAADRCALDAGSAIRCVLCRNPGGSENKKETSIHPKRQCPGPRLDWTEGSAHPACGDPQPLNPESLARSPPRPLPRHPHLSAPRRTARHRVIPAGPCRSRPCSTPPACNGDGIEADRSRAHQQTIPLLAVNIAVNIAVIFNHHRRKQLQHATVRKGSSPACGPAAA